MKYLSIGLLAGVALAGASLVPARAMPVSDLAAVSREAAAPFQNVAYVCGRHRCRWRPTYVAPTYVAPPYCGYGPGWYACGRALYGGWYGWPGSWPGAWPAPLGGWWY